jgi:hypothetical protein
MAISNSIEKRYENVKPGIEGLMVLTEALYYVAHLLRNNYGTLDYRQNDQ